MQIEGETFIWSQRATSVQISGCIHALKFVRPTQDWLSFIIWDRQKTDQKIFLKSIPVIFYEFLVSSKTILILRHHRSKKNFGKGSPGINRLIHLCLCCPGFDISTSPLAPTSEFLKKGLSGKYILVFTCPNGQADFLSTLHFFYVEKMAQIPKYANNATKFKRNWFYNH